MTPKSLTLHRMDIIVNGQDRLKEGREVEQFPVSEVADVIEEAAHIISVGGLTKHNYSDGEGAHCTLGALGVTAETDQLFARAEVTIASYLQTQGHGMADGFDPGHSFAIITKYNDRPERTQDEVVDMLKTVAKDLRNEGA